MKNGRIKIADIRREEIVDASVTVIAEQGIQKLSLSEIEKKVGMSRGQLTYYFRTKEDILLAVFDRLLAMMCQQHDGAEHPFAQMDWFEIVRHLLNMVLQEPAAHPEFHALQHAFLSQISHREDFRSRLADLYEKWRCHGANDLQRQLEKRPAVRKVSARAMATVVQAMLHGLAVQKAADPKSIDQQDVVHLCLDLLGTYLWASRPPTPSKRAVPKRKAKTRTRGIQ